MTAVRPRPRVLVVDDDPGNRMLCSVSLRFAGIEVVEAKDGRRALARAFIDPPDAIVLDVMMPGLDGFELAEMLRREDRTRRVPLVFLTGEAGRSNQRRAHALGARAYVAKPFEPAALAAVVLAAVTAGAPDHTSIRTGNGEESPTPSSVGRVRS